MGTIQRLCVRRDMGIARCRDFTGCGCYAWADLVISIEQAGDVHPGEFAGDNAQFNRIRIFAGITQIQMGCKFVYLGKHLGNSKEMTRG